MEEIRKMSLNQGRYLIGYDINQCKCGGSDASVISYFVQTTRYIENVMNGSGDVWWECEQCKDTRRFNEFHPKECDFNFCPNCGRKIVDFVDIAEESEEAE